MVEKVNERITTRLPEETLSKMDEFMRVNGITNRSELIRLSLEYFIERHRNLISPETLRYSSIDVELPQRAALALEYMDDSGYVKVSTLRGVLEDTAANWINEKAKQHVNLSLDEVLNEVAERKKLESKVTDIVRK